jgi:hypothetical protein
VIARRPRLERSRTPFAYRKVSEIVDVQPRTHRIQTNEYLERGRIPVIDQGAARVAGYIDDTERAYDGPLPVVIFGDHTCTFKFAKNRFAVGADGTQLLTGKSDMDTRFLYYALQTAPVEQFGYQRHFKLLKDSQVAVPPLPIQRRIAAILGAYDDLIQVNWQRIALLEEMTRGLFDEWFVHFRLPGRDGRAPAKASSKALPDGWRREELGALCAEVRDSVSPADVDSDTPYVGLEHLPRRSTTLDAWGRAAEVTSTKLRFEAGDVLFGKIRPYFHKVVFAPFEGICSSDAIVIRSFKTEHAGLVLSVTSSDDFVAHAVATSNGTKMPRANWSVLARTPVAVPPRH